MVSQTRSYSAVTNEIMKGLKGPFAQMIREEMENMGDEMRNAIVKANGGTVVRNQGDQRKNMVDNVPDDQKVYLISIHLFAIALMWHRQFLRLIGGDTMTRLVYRGAIMQRFGNSFEDPLTELKDCKYETSIEDYQMPMMFKPQTLETTYSLSKLQVATNGAIKKKYKAPLLSNPKFNNYPIGGNIINSPKPLVLPAPNANWRNKVVTPQVAPIGKRLSQKEIKEKGAKNLCFYCDQRYVHGHKCVTQVYLLEVFDDEKELEEQILLFADEETNELNQLLTEIPHFLYMQ
uniref:Reverse transcriptase domain-containing protein n=1 Tax=Tanacetum cinerariifolium TaxID=118510 RepID=A0A699H508_TANCI|nr:hypothetical protein [Tanacetum cinerariifolium]